MNYHTKYLKYKNKYLNLKNKIGGTKYCQAVGFNEELREATLGTAYPTAIVNHFEGERDTYEKLVDISTRGMVGWYCKQANLTPEECKIITDMPEVQILGAFYHRYKVFIEHFNETMNKLKDEDNFISKLNFQKKGEQQMNNILISYEKALPLLKTYLKNTPESKYAEFSDVSRLLNLVVDNVQCLLWVIIKNKKLPDGFIMDERIKNRAYDVIKINNNNLISYSVLLSTMKQYLDKRPVAAILSIKKFIELVEKDNIELSNPIVTFNVF